MRLAPERDIFISKNLLVPRKLEGRFEKQRQNLLKLLQQEVIEGDLKIDTVFDFSKDEINLKRIDGSLYLQNLKKCPEYLRGVHVKDAIVSFKMIFDNDHYQWSQEVIGRNQEF